MGTWIYYCCLLLLLIMVIGVYVYASSAFATEETTASSRSYFLWLSDIHLDPYYGTEQAMTHNNAECASGKESTHPWGDIGCDSPRALVEATLQQAAASTTTTTSSSSSDVDLTPGGTLDFCLITGDFVRHGNDQLDNPIRATESILRNVSDLLVHHLGTEMPMVPSIGNNDVTPDYYLDVNNPTPMLSAVARGLSPLLVPRQQQSSSSTSASNDTTTADPATEPFARGGYFARHVTPHILVLSLNTILYSTNHQPAPRSSETLPVDPLGQFAWLRDQLERAASSSSARQPQQQTRTVYIMGHIPPTIGSYRHTQLWHQVYLETYNAIVGTYTPHLVKAQLFGHLHTDEFRVHGSNVPLWLAPSVTPIYGSNPSFRVVAYQAETGTLLDYYTRYLDLQATRQQQQNNNSSSSSSTTAAAVWKTGESFIESYKVPDLSGTSLSKLVSGLQLQDSSSSTLDDDDDASSGSTNGTNSSTSELFLWDALLRRHHVYDGSTSAATCDADCRREWICVLTSTTKEQYNACILDTHGETKPDATNATTNDDSSTFSLSGRNPWMVVAIIIAGSLLLAIALSLQAGKFQRHGRFQVPTHEIELGQQHHHQQQQQHERKCAVEHEDEIPEIS